MVTTTCFQDLTKKTKMKGLSTTSWGILIILGFISWFVFFYYAIFIAIALYGILATLEYFDEDIYTIIGVNFKISNKIYYP